MNRAEHWETVYRTNRPDRHSWFQAGASLSRRLIETVAPDREARIVDIGAGASTLVDGLLADGYRDLSVLDISGAALEVAKERLGSAATKVTWWHADLLTTELPPAGFDLWHDRAVFHFLTEAADRACYIDQVRHSVRPGGHLIMATFALDGPIKCSGLEVVRYSSDELRAQFGSGFDLIATKRELHATPSGKEQAFNYSVLQINT